jgi:hypothetical protein
MALVTCRYCGVQIILSVSGVWVALPYADLSGFCPATVDDERHQPGDPWVLAKWGDAMA